MEVFFYFFLIFFLLALGIAFVVKKPFLVCLGYMFMLAAVVLVVWSFVIDDGSRRGMEALVLAIMWGFAAGSFILGLILRKIGISHSRKKALSEMDVVENGSRNETSDSGIDAN